MDPDPHPDPFVTGTDPRIRIRNKMSRIRNIYLNLSLLRPASITAPNLDRLEASLEVTFVIFFYVIRMRGRNKNNYVFLFGSVVVFTAIKFLHQRKINITTF
jgi:hypothetical protein